MFFLVFFLSFCSDDDGISDLLENSVLVTADITLNGLNANEFTSKKTEIASAIATHLGVSSSRLYIRIQSRRRLAAGDSVILEAKMSVATANAGAMETKITAINLNTFATEVSNAAGLTITAAVSVPVTETFTTQLPTGIDR